MRLRNVQKIVRLTEKEAKMLETKSRKSGMSEAAYIRGLISGYEPKEKPDMFFYECMNNMLKFAEDIKRISLSMTDKDAAEALKAEASEWKKLRLEIIQRFL